MPIVTIGDLICSLLDLKFTANEIAQMSVDDMYLVVLDCFLK